MLIEGHYADLVKSDQIQAAIILRCQPEILSQRLAERQYSPAKINENVQAEIVGDCTSYMLEKGRLMETHCIFEINTGALTWIKVQNYAIKSFISLQNIPNFLLVISHGCRILQ